MKIKSSQKKLAFKKETIARLGNAEMNQVRGAIYTGNSCQTNLICTQPRCCERTYDCKTIQIC